MPLSKSTLERLEELQSLFEKQEYDQVISECISLRSSSKAEQGDDDDESDAQLANILYEIQAKAHLQLDQLKEVQDLVSSQSNNSRLQPLAAYAQYRLKNYSKAKKLSTSIIEESDNVLARHVLAQSLYRMGDTESSWNEYHSISIPDDEVEQAQLLTNALGVRNSNATPLSVGSENGENDALVEKAQAIFSKEMMNSEIPFDMYELAYNLGTYHLLFNADDAEDTSEGGSILETAETAIRNELGDDEEAIEDLAPVLTNIAWSKHRGGSESISYPKGAKGTEFINKVNTTILKEKNGGGQRAEKENSFEKELPANITSLQRRLFHYNQAILAFRRKQYPVAKTQLQLLQRCILAASNQRLKRPPTAPCATSRDLEFWKSRIAVLEAHMLEQQGKVKEAKELLGKQNYESDYAQAWTQLHLKRIEGKLETPEDQLIALETCLPSSFQSKPAVAATRAMLYQKTGKTMPGELLDDEQRGDMLLSQGEYEEAIPYFSSRSDPASQANYLLCLTFTDPEKAEEVAKSGLDFEFPSFDLDAEALEAQELPRLKAVRATLSDKTLAVSVISSQPKRSHESVMKRRAKKREAYVQKLQERGLDTSKAPNPDRWLPKHERRNNKNRRRGQQHRGAQGGYSQADAAKLDVANRAAIAPSSKSTAHMTVAGGETGRR
eukprot:CAMPEP_0194215578 /NCGR_PEP_ID=MMETSP0156-20130528/17488_1 /TAXON_ID=33649 /ORGANISM="Thalassionema nitzschioides, Strain L26-B" /LENGTH=667 /DNA_ID=CAMNT_0038944127 /DNA_START=88 /DNA_END=2088 /DNA_ORIENTATION=+